jgi:DNA-binding NarL/FixJ family response regulator
MDKRSDIPLRILLVASSSARRAYLAENILRAMNGRAHVISDSQISAERFAASKSDLLLADLETPAEADALVRFLEDAPAGTGSVALADEPGPRWVRSALRASLNAIIARDASREDIQLALQAAEAGLVLLHPTSASGLIQESSLRDTSGDATEELAEELTARESEVLRLVSLGLGNKEVAGRLAISEHTVKFHISSILGKLHAGSRTEAVSLGIRRGLISI